MVAVVLSAGSTPTHGSRRDLDAPHLGLLDELSFQPVFILGDHRSGTSVLYTLLHASGCFNVVQAYHILRYGEILSNHLNQREDEARAQLTGELRAAGQETRVIDELPVSAELTEEYGFLVSRSARPQLTSENLPRFIELCRKVQFVAGDARPLLLKNTWDYLNFMFIKQAFPQARFVFVHRHPARVISSQIKAVRTAFAGYTPYMAMLAEWYVELHRKPWHLRALRSLYSPRHQAGYRIARRHVRKASGYYLRHIHDLAPETYVEVHYEDLCRDPDATLHSILSFLGLKEPAPVAYAPMVQPRTGRLLPEVERGASKLETEFAAYCDHCGFVPSTGQDA